MKEVSGDYGERRAQRNNPPNRFLKRRVNISLALILASPRKLIVAPIPEVDIRQMTNTEAFRFGGRHRCEGTDNLPKFQRFCVAFLKIWFNFCIRALPG
jgi:hypothetical protein